MAGYRRVTKQEDPKAWKAERYTRAAPGKFTKKSATISQRQFQQKKFAAKVVDKKDKKTSREQRTKLREKFGTQTAAQIKAIQSRRRLKIMREYLEEEGDDVDQADPDNALIRLYRSTRLARGQAAAWRAVKKALKKEEFRQLFKTYPEDDVRGWLGSSEESRARRLSWKSARLAA